ncbi:MAG: hypothetical protein HYY37_06030 [Candidatus Aenigmarchaeota archaeon]|nr:hypothetical protein [Candidatus Aenigmarchaeota archaeon]
MIYTTFSANWFALLAIPLALFAVIFLYRASYRKKNETRQNVVFAASALALAALIEYVGITLNLWHYVDGDWPIILWLIYAMSGLAGYQMAKLVTEKIR